VDRSDFDAATFDGRGPFPGFSVPGQDFVTTVAPTAIPAWLDLRGSQVLLSLEPDPDDSTEPFLPLFTGVMPTMTEVPSAPLSPAQVPALSGFLSFER
jgi:hypothetical protein